MAKMNHNIATLILAGGESRRMLYQDKGLLRLAHKSLISHVLGHLTTQSSSIFIVANQHLSEYQSLINLQLVGNEQAKIQLIQDIPDFKGLGPLAGIASVIEHLPNDVDALQLSSCDTPFLPINLIAQLAQAREQTNHSIVIPATQNHAHFCHAQIARSALNDVYELLAQGRYRLQDFLEFNHDSLLVNFEDESAFINCNTPESLIEAEKLLITKLS